MVLPLLQSWRTHMKSEDMISNRTTTATGWSKLTTAYGTQLPKVIAILSPFLIPRSRRPRASESLARFSSRYVNREDGVLIAILPENAWHIAANFSLMVFSSSMGYSKSLVSRTSSLLEYINAPHQGQTRLPGHVLLPRSGSSVGKSTLLCLKRRIKRNVILLHHSQNTKEILWSDEYTIRDLTKFHGISPVWWLLGDR